MRRIVLLALLIAGLGGGAQVAEAKFVFADLYNRTFTPGELLDLQMQGCNAYCGREVGGKVAALTPVVRPASQKRICAAKRWPLARMTRSGGLRFVMPDVPTGRYQIVLRYITNPKMPCRWGAMSQPFRVVGDGD
jgi:hypothetical protein